MLSKQSALEIDVASQPIHLRRRFEGPSTEKIHEWLAEAIGVFSMVDLDDAQHLARAGAHIARTALGSGRAISIDLLLDGEEVEIRLAMDGNGGSKAVLLHHTTSDVVGDGTESVH
jgi:hypothetical protein